MPRKLRIAYIAHSIRSDWNNGNAHFLRGLLRGLAALGHQVIAFEAESGWSIENLRAEPGGEDSLRQFADLFPELRIELYAKQEVSDAACWQRALAGLDFVIFHEWNEPKLAHTLLSLRDAMGYRLFFHDTHHRASSSPQSIANFGVDRFDGVLAFGESLSAIYRERFGIASVWTLHEAADTTVFKPLTAAGKTSDVVWIGNWGDDERSSEIREFLLQPASELAERRFAIYGVRYPEDGLAALRAAGVHYGGYLPNLAAPGVYAGARLTVHIPRQQYLATMTGIPTIRVFEALACGVPLISAPWADTEHLFREGDYLSVRNGGEMRRAIEYLLNDPEIAESQARRGLETVLARHTCRHRAEHLAGILEELLS